ncbi:MAG: hypothetical protein PVJ32_09545, partial [Anaerolineales bacterium]
SKKRALRLGAYGDEIRAGGGVIQSRNRSDWMRYRPWKRPSLSSEAFEVIWGGTDGLPQCIMWG